MPAAEVVYMQGRHLTYRCKRCQAGMTCCKALTGRTTLRCIDIQCGLTLYVYSISLGDSQIDLEVWPHECPVDMPLGTYVEGLVRELGTLAA